jgi:phage terminase small subunit
MSHTNGTLTAAQERFAQEYLSDLNASAAYGRAYPSAKPKTREACGSRMLGNAKVSARIAVLQAERAERLEITQDYVLTRLRENVERAMQAEPVRDREGNLTGEYVYAGAVANQALTLLGKHLGMFGDKQEHSGEVRVRVIREAATVASD